MPVRRGARPCCSSPRTRRTAAALRRRRTRRRTSRTASTTPSSTASRDAVNPARTGTKAAAHYSVEVPAGGSVTVDPPRADAVATSPRRRCRAHATGAPDRRSASAIARDPRRRAGRGRRVLRRPPAADAQRRRARASSARRSRACCGRSSSTTTTSTTGSKAIPASLRRPPSARTGAIRVAAPQQRDIISMPDKWEYPWFAAWDLAFHCIPLALVDPEFAKEQLAAARARVVPASQRADPGLRVGVRRRQSAGASRGPPGASTRSTASRAARATSRSSSASSTRCC